ncbi:MAG: nicotinate (nicotinamide) nucleotide adenylyltransferase [Oscillospiraceae bacterium]|jgi:nicotinate-nucleotide adenylyltransferase
MKVAIFGGSFNPPHKGHVQAALDAISYLKPDKLLVIPAAIPPHKSLGEDSPSPEERFELARLAFSGIPQVQVSDIELKRSGKSYTVDTISQLRDIYPDARFYLLLGTDMFLSFERWYEFRRILDNAALAVFARDWGEDGAISNFAGHLSSAYGARVVIIPREILPMASMDARVLFPKRQGADCVPPEVYAHIIKKRLYKAKPEFSWLRRQAYKMLDPRRIPHVQGCEQEAVKLAQRWGEDPEDAAETAILHDITKKLLVGEQLLLCERYGIIIDSLEARSPKLLHAKTGAALAEDLFGVSAKVKNAIRWHTTGRADMSLLEKIIYLADYIEPTRSFKGLSALKALAYEDIDEALLLGLEMTLDELKRTGVTPHRNSIDAMEFLKTRRERFK